MLNGSQVNMYVNFPYKIGNNAYLAINTLINGFDIQWGG